MSSQVQCSASKIYLSGVLLFLDVTSALPKSKTDWFRISKSLLKRFGSLHLLLKWNASEVVLSAMISISQIYF